MGLTVVSGAAAEELAGQGPAASARQVEALTQPMISAVSGELAGDHHAQIVGRFGSDLAEFAVHLASQFGDLAGESGVEGVEVSSCVASCE